MLTSYLPTETAMQMLEPSNQKHADDVDAATKPLNLVAIRARYERADAGNDDALRPLALTDVPALLAEVERLTAELAKVDRLAQSGIRAEAEAVRQVEAERAAALSLVEQRDADLERLRAAFVGVNARATALVSELDEARRDRDRFDKDGTGVIRERDEYHEVADNLAHAIAALTGVEIGEHSSMNDPWANALKAAEDAEDLTAEHDRYRAVVREIDALVRLWRTEDEPLNAGDCWAALEDALSAAEPSEPIKAVTAAHPLTFDHRVELGVRVLCQAGDFAGVWRASQSEATADHAAHVREVANLAEMNAAERTEVEERR